MSYKIIGKYIKELNFNIPNPKTFFLLSKNIANYKINIDIESSQAKQNIIEVRTSLGLSPTNDNFETINTRRQQIIQRRVGKNNPNRSSWQDLS